MVASVPIGQARQPHNPISRRQIETVVSRSVAIFGLAFGAQSVPAMLGQMSEIQTVWYYVMAIGIFGGLVASIVASFARRLVRFINGYIALAYLVALVIWPFVARDPGMVADDRPWLWLLCTVGTSAAAVAFSTWAATVYLVLAPVVYGIVRITPSGGGKTWESAALDTAYAIILGGAVLILITLLRQAAASVDNAQSTALDRYAHAVRQHATEVERVQVDSIVHDSVLTTLLSAARAYTPEAKELSTRMARNAMGHLKDAAATSPDDDATVSMDQLAHRIVGATATLSAPFELKTAHIENGVIPVQSAEAVYSAAVQAMVNSLQHAGAGDDVRRWLTIQASVGGGIQVDVGDTGAGFDVDSVPTERLGLRVSIIERVANAGGTVEVESSAGRGTVISIVWPHPDAMPTLAATAIGEQVAP
ncbi:ATP-binding protein [Glaciihabitans sp. UYNi722]|uniref:sensor histidine kinase n=1 Tax=Glaciihabitans sp. UYNi722 TaxID=3156344 RepID=UPI0033929B10